MNKKSKEILDYEYNEYINNYKKRKRKERFNTISSILGIFIFFWTFPFTADIWSNNSNYEMITKIIISTAFLLGFFLMIISILTLEVKNDRNDLLLDKHQYYKNKVISMVEDSYKSGISYYKNKHNNLFIDNEEYILDEDGIYKENYIFYKNKSRYKELSLSEIKLLRNGVLNIKNKMSAYEFDELIFRTEKKSGKKIGNAYFYIVLFERYQEILKEIQYDKKEKEILSIKSNSLICDKGYSDKNYSNVVGHKEKIMTILK